MIDLETALEDQTDLTALCEVPEAERRTNLHTFNDFYGFASILKRYAGYPEDRPVKAVIPHGVYFDSQILDMELESEYRAVLNYPAFRAEAWEAQAGRVVIPSASPFLYALSMFREAFPEPEAQRGTFFIPAHTVQMMRTSADWNAIAEELLALPDEFQPVTVCMYYVDYLKTWHQPFAKRGMRIVSAGHTGDPEFIYRWLHLLSQHRHVMSNDVGGGVLYSSATGKPVTLLPELAETFFDASVHVVAGRVLSAQARQTRDRIAELFRADDPASGTAREEVVSYLLGGENFKSAEALRGDLEYAARLAEQ